MESSSKVLKENQLNLSLTIFTARMLLQSLAAAFLCWWPIGWLPHKRRNKESASERQRVSVLCYNNNQEWTWKISNLKLSKWRISRDHIKQLTALHVNSWHHLEDRRFDFTLTFTDVVYKLEMKLEFAMENKTVSNCNCYYVQSNTCWADCFCAVPKE